MGRGRGRDPGSRQEISLLFASGASVESPKWFSVDIKKRGTSEPVLSHRILHYSSILYYDTSIYLISSELSLLLRSI